MQMHDLFNRALLATVLAVVLLTLVTGCACGRFFPRFERRCRAQHEPGQHQHQTR